MTSWAAAEQAPADLDLPNGVEQVPAGFTDFALIGRGGQASVYRARDVDLDRYVALKALVVPGAAASPPAAMDEVRMLVELSGHPNVLAVYDVHWVREPTGNATCWIEMELCDGGSLLDWVEQQRSRQADEDSTNRALAQALRIGEQISAALAHARTRDAVHGDVKLANVLLTDAGHAKLADLGVATIAGEGGSRSIPHSSPPYLAPELEGGRSPATWQSDVYALGAVLHQLRQAVVDDPDLVDPVARSAELPTLMPRSIPKVNAAPVAAAELDHIIATMTTPNPSARTTAQYAAVRLEHLRVRLEAVTGLNDQVTTTPIADPDRQRRVNPAAVARQSAKAVPLWRRRSWAGKVAAVAGLAVVFTAAWAAAQSGTQQGTQSATGLSPIASPSPTWSLLLGGEGGEPLPGEDRPLGPTGGLEPGGLPGGGGPVVVLPGGPSNDASAEDGSASTGGVVPPGNGVPTRVPGGSNGTGSTGGSGGSTGTSTQSQPPTDGAQPPPPKQAPAPTCSLVYDVWGGSVDGSGYARGVAGGGGWIMQSLSNISQRRLEWLTVNIGAPDGTVVNIKVYVRTSLHTTGDFQELRSVNAPVVNNGETRAPLDVTLPDGTRTFYLQVYNASGGEMGVYLHKQDVFAAGRPEDNTGTFVEGDLNGRLCAS